MLTQDTIDKMNAMKLFGMVVAFDNQLSSTEYDELSFEERVGVLIDAEWTDREQRKLSRRLKAAKLRYPASLEDVNFRAARGLNRQQILTLGKWSLDRRAPQPPHHRAHRDRKVVPRLRLRRESMSSRIHRLLRPRLATRP